MLLDESREAGFLAIVDADFNRLSGTESPPPNCIFTDRHDLIVLLLASGALKRLLLEGGSADKIAAFERTEGAPVLTAIMRRLRPLAICDC